jgi:hypothetical protein
MVDVFSIDIRNETLKPVEAILRRGREKRENNGGDESNQAHYTTWKTKIRRITVPGQPGQKVCKFPCQCKKELGMVAYVT